MMGARGALAAAALAAAGCKVVDEPFSETFPAEGITRVAVEVEVGNIAYTAADIDEFVVRGVATGRGLSEKAAQGDNEWTIEITGGALVVTGESAGFGSIDFDIEGPVAVAVEAATPAGDVVIDAADGAHSVDAGTFTGIDLRGQLHATVLAGLVADIAPSDPGSLAISSAGGAVVLGMPYGGSYALEVQVDDESTYEIADLGFEDWGEYESSFSGTTGGGTIVVDVDIAKGSFELVEYDAPDSALGD